MCTADVGELRTSSILKTSAKPPAKLVGEKLIRTLKFVACPSLKDRAVACASPTGSTQQPVDANPSTMEAARATPTGSAMSRPACPCAEGLPHLPGTLTASMWNVTSGRCL